MSKHKWLVAAMLAVLAAACIAGSAAAKAPPGYTAAQFDATAKAKFTTDTGAEPFRTSKTIPYWGSSFTDPTNGVTYPYTMVGTNPYGAPVTTTVPSEIIPFKFNFSDGTVMDGSADVSKTIASPVSPTTRIRCRRTTRRRRVTRSTARSGTRSGPAITSAWARRPCIPRKRWRSRRTRASRS